MSRAIDGLICMAIEIFTVDGVYNDGQGRPIFYKKFWLKQNKKGA